MFRCLRVLLANYSANLWFSGSPTYACSCVLAETAFQNTGVGESVLDVCAKTDGAVIQLGIGTLGNTFLYNFSDFVTPPELHPEAPDGVFTYQIDQYSPLGLHWWSVTDDAENIMTAADPMFRMGTFPKALSLWVNRVQGYITAWVFEPADPAPDLLLIWKVSRAVTVALDVCHKHAHLYVATSKPAQLHMFDVKNPAVTTLEHPLATVDGKAEGFKDIRSIVPIYTTSTDDCKPLILVLDRDSGFLLLYNTDLTLIKKTNQLDGMTSPMSHPSSLSCTPRTPTGSSNFLETWDCVIVDSETSLVIYFRVNPLTQTILFLNDYRKGSLKESRNTGIQSPNGVLAHRFANKTLIYVAEEESPDMHLLLVEEEENLIRFEDFVRPADTGPAIRHIFIIPIKLYPDNPEDVLLATLREGLSGPSLLFTLLSNTGQVPEFFYQPREWYGVGDTHTLEPLPRGSGTLDRIREYTFDATSKDSAYVSSIATIDRETGVIHLSIAHVYTQDVLIIVIGNGLVNKQVSEFTIRVACRDGYYVNNGTCVKCEAGTYNSMLLVAEKPHTAWAACHSCPSGYSTVTEGAVSANQCQCQKGYHLDEQGTNCVPCPAGTTNEVDQSGEAKTALSSCLCDKGYTPASLEALEDPSSTASLLKAYLTSSLHYTKLLDSQVCIKCEKGYYKDAVGNQKCEPCPKNSYTPTLGATSLENCSQCAPGYFPSGDAGKPCRKCPKDHFCVGSEPTISTLIRYANKMVPCPPFSKTLLFAVNDHPFKCMCRTGYELQSVGIGLDVVCVRTRLNHYKDIVSNMPGTPCPSNTVTATTKSTSTFDCICLPGQFLNKATNECEPCPTGFYCVGKRDPNDFTDAQPIKCPPLTSTYDLGASEFKQCLCDKGYQRKKVQSGIQKDVQCSPCPVNTYKDWVGDAVCRACGENSGTRNEGATSAAQCLCFKGYYYSYTISQCTACSGDSRKYCPGGEEACDADDPRCVDGKKPAEPQPCPKHTRIPAGYDAASSVDDCKCEPGFGFKSGESSEEGSTCVPCPPGTYKPSVQNSACNSLCGASATSFPGARSQSQCFCEEGTFRVGETCHSCPAGAICAGGLLVEAQVKLQRDPHFTRITSAHHVKPYAKAGFFLSKLREELRTLNDWRFTPCPIEKACLEWGRCVETMTEYLCSECRPNFTSNFAKGELCTACPSMGWNIALLTLYYLGTLLFNIMMTYMNVAAGFNRKSIHSIVIKIASNFLTCMSIVGILDLKTIELPEWVAKLTRRVTERVTVTQRVQWLSVDCLLRQGFRLSYPESFFYTMLFYALLPIALPIVATAIMYVVLWRTQAWYRASTQRKLNMIKQAEQCGLEALSDQLRERCAQDRVFLIFRYIPIPGESRLTRFTKFMEDMIPIYVTVLFFLHSPTTTQMLSLLDCTYTDFGRGHKPKYFLRAAMSVECQIGLGKPYFKYLALGMVGLCTWSIGIPLSGFVVLYMKRKDLYSRATRLKYGFLHNGFLKKYWYWETVAFARKLLVLMSTSVGLIHSKNTVSSRVWLAMVIAIVFLLFHSLAQPFDKRSYLTLDRLETHSMGIWTITCVIMAMVLGSDLGGNTNMALLCFVVLLVFLFLLDVAFSLVIAYFDNVRAQKTFFTVPLIGHVFKFFGRLSEKRRAHEPVVIYDAENENFQLVAAKRRGWHFFGKKTEKIHLAERDYFIKVMTETMWFAVAHMKLNVIPGAFLEFILLLGMTIHKMDENSQENNKSLQAIADGDLSRLAEWSRNERVKKEGAKVVAQRKRDIKRRMRNFYNRLGKGLHRRKGAGFLKLDCAAADGDGHKISDYEDSDATEGTASTSSEQDARDDDQVDEVETASSTLPSLTEGSVADWDSDMLLLIDKQQITTGIVLSELYLALLKLQQKDSSGIGNQYEAFRNQRLAALEAHTEQLLEKNNKLKLIRLAFQSLLTNSPEELRRLGIDEASFSRTTQELSDLNQKICELNSILQDLETNPEKVDTCPEEEWVDKEVFDDFLAHRSAESQGVEQPAESSSEDGLFQHSETANQNEGNEL